MKVGQWRPRRLLQQFDFDKKFVHLVRLWRVGSFQDVSHRIIFVAVNYRVTLKFILAFCVLPFIIQMHMRGPLLVHGISNRHGTFNLHQF